jgi:hypothetical protein
MTSIFSLSSIDIIRNKLKWVGAGISTTEEESTQVAGLDGTDPQRVWHAAARVLRTLRASPDTTQSGTVRQRAVGRGRKGQLRTAEQKLLFILVYQKAYPLQILLAEVFELSQSRVNYWVHCCYPCCNRPWRPWRSCRNAAQPVCPSARRQKRGGRIDHWMGPTAAGSARRTRKNRLCTTVANTRRTVTRMW